jgi:hypothetical protein
MSAKKAWDAPASDEPSKSLNALARRASALKDWLAEDAPASDDPSKTSTAAQANLFLPQLLIYAPLMEQTPRALKCSRCFCCFLHSNRYATVCD